MSQRWSLRIAQILFFLGCLSAINWAHSQESSATVQLNFPQEIEIKGFVDYVSERTGLRILYDEKIASRKISIRSPVAIPVETLPSVLRSALRMKGLLLVDAEVEGWKAIVESSRIGEFADADPQNPDAEPVTQIFLLEHVEPTNLETSLKVFLTQPGGNLILLKEQRILIVSDFISNVNRIGDLLRIIDRPRASSLIHFIEIEHLPAKELASRLTALLEARGRAEGLEEGKSIPLVVQADERGNRLIVIGPGQRVEEVRELIRQLDVGLTIKTEVYSPTNLPVARLDRLARSLFSAADQRQPFESTLDQDENLLVVSTTPAIHERIAELIQKLDISEQPTARSRIKFYKLKHVNAEDALETLRAIEGDVSQSAGRGRNSFSDGNFRMLSDVSTPVGGYPRTQVLTPLLGAVGFPPPASAGTTVGPLPALPGQTSSTESRTSSEATAGRGESDATRPVENEIEAILSRGRVTADFNANSLIVIGDPAAQALYMDLIERIDIPRLQVLIEAKVVVLDVSDGFSLGVEVSGGGRSGAKRLFAFTSFGLSTVNPVTGALSIIPGNGFNGTLVDPDVADVVLRAFTNHRRARIVSSPRVLVSDNATGTLSAVNEVPFTNVNASQTVSTTSFGGYAKAGTTIQVLPHVSAKDQLQLEFKIAINDFTGAQPNASVPPPRQTEEITSEVTIPDGHTLIVGGLNQANYSKSVGGVPYLELIPIIKYLTSNTTQSGRESSLFIFLRPVILRDDKFRDLKYFSERDARRSQSMGDFPVSRPILIK